MDESGIIAQYFRPLATDKAAFELQNDAALLPDAQIVTSDLLLESIHALLDTPAHLLARKALRMNLSDIAAMGGTPTHYTLNIACPAHMPPNWFADFTAGLAMEQQMHGISLLGGDLSLSTQDVVISVTMFGHYAENQHPFRHDTARAGQKLYYSGQVGGALIGLKALQSKREEEFPASIAAYELPEPQLGIISHLQAYGVDCAVDASDGLLKALTLLTQRSGVGAVLQAAALPLISESQAAMPAFGITLDDMLQESDDYGLLFTAAADFPLVGGICYVGKVTEDKALILKENDKFRALTGQGYSHAFVTQL